MIRGIERRKIFRDNKDRDNFLERLANLLPEAQGSNLSHGICIKGLSDKVHAVYYHLRGKYIANAFPRQSFHIESSCLLLRHLGISVPGVGYAVERGEAIAWDNNYQLIELFYYFFKDCPA